MYKLLLISKYLRRKLAPMFAALAVTLCTMMVIIVISVMGGFLDLLKGAAHQLTGDVIVTPFSLTGFGHYEQIIEELEALPEVAAASPTVRAYGLMNLDGRTIPVEIEGIKPTKLDQVVRYRSTLHWDAADYVAYYDRLFPERDDRDPAEQAYIDSRRQHWAQMDLKQMGMDLQPPDEWQVEGGGSEGIVLGIAVNPRQERDDQGNYDIANSAIGETVTLTVVPLSQQGSLEAYGPSYQKFVVVNEFKSGLYDIDANRVYVPFATLQRLLKMDAQKVWTTFDPDTGEPTGDPIIEPGRATEIAVKASQGYTAEQTQAAVREVVRKIADRNLDMPMLFTLTWQQRHQGLLSAVENEKGLVTFLFVIISVVAIVMVATTFYMIVLEKTRDVGVLRAVGASRLGIMNIFLGYGLVIGIVGSLIGLAAAVGIVTHLNEIQNLLDAWFGWRMWDPKTYYFDRIPDQVKALDATVIVLGAILSSVIGALIPALLAARLDPVEALRYE